MPFLPSGLIGALADALLALLAETAAEIAAEDAATSLEVILALAAFSAGVVGLVSDSSDLLSCFCWLEALVLENKLPNLDTGLVILDMKEPMPKACPEAPFTLFTSFPTRLFTASSSIDLFTRLVPAKSAN